MESLMPTCNWRFSSFKNMRGFRAKPAGRWFVCEDFQRHRPQTMILSPIASRNPSTILMSELALGGWAGESQMCPIV